MEWASMAGEGAQWGRELSGVSRWSLLPVALFYRPPCATGGEDGVLAPSAPHSSLLLLLRFLGVDCSGPPSLLLPPTVPL